MTELLKIPERKQRAEDELTRVRITTEHISARRTMLSIQPTEVRFTHEELLINAVTIETASAISQQNQPVSRRQGELKRILEQIEAGKYDGRCLKCGSSISWEMFNAIPSEHCAPCRGHTVSQ